MTEGIVKLGALLRIPADLSDPVLSAGPEGYPLGVTREYYTFIFGSLDKIPVVRRQRARAAHAAPAASAGTGRPCSGAAGSTPR